MIEFNVSGSWLLDDSGQAEEIASELKKNPTLQIHWISQRTIHYSFKITGFPDIEATIELSKSFPDHYFVFNYRSTDYRINGAMAFHNGTHAVVEADDLYKVVMDWVQPNRSLAGHRSGVKKKIQEAFNNGDDVLGVINEFVDASEVAQAFAEHLYDQMNRSVEIVKTLEKNRLINTAREFKANSIQSDLDVSIFKWLEADQKAYVEDLEGPDNRFDATNLFEICAIYDAAQYLHMDTAEVVKQQEAATV